MHAVDQWFNGMPQGKHVPFDITDSAHETLRDLRKRVKEAGGKVSAVKSLPRMAEKAWETVVSKTDGDYYKLGDARYYELLAEKFFGGDQTPVKPKTKVSKSSKTTKKAVKASSKKIAGQKIYMLFDATQFGNSSDAAYELEYAFRGIYLSEEDALKAFAESMVENNHELDDEFETTSTAELNELLEKYNWKILTDTVPSGTTKSGPEKTKAPKKVVAKKAKTAKKVTQNIELQFDAPLEKATRLPSL